MALQPPVNPGGERLSQLLPTVKCSSCGNPVALSDLGDHICASAPPLPPPPKPSALLAKIRQASLSISIPGANGSRTSAAPRSAPPVRRSHTPQPQPSPPVAIPPPKSATPGPSMFSRRRSSSTLRSQTPRMSTSTSSSPMSVPLRLGTPGPLPPQPPVPQTAPPPVGAFDGIPRSSTPGSARRPSMSSVRDSRMRTPSAPERPGNIQGPTSMNRPPGPMSPGPMPVRPSMDGALRMSMDRPGSTRPSFESRPSYDSNSRVPSPLSPASTRGPPTPVGQAPVGQPMAMNGEVNMAGVGRRAFQAVAQAALLTSSLSNSIQNNQDRMRSPAPGMDGRRENVPGQLNIKPQVQSPPSLSPHTPLSSQSPRSPYGFDQHGIASHSPSPIGSGFPFGDQPPAPPSKSPDGVSSRTVSPRSSRLNNKDLTVNTSRPVNDAPPLGSPHESECSSIGLAYDQETESALSPTSPHSTGTVGMKTGDGVQFPSQESPQMSIVGLPTRSASTASSYSLASRVTTKSASAVDRALDTLFEEGRSPPLPTQPLSPRSPKLPMRARTTPTMGTKNASLDSTETRRPRNCTRCTRSISDGRWIRAEGAGVLCERCWKTMYLPKCRRCNRPIEKQAVSSADGQLKGKYHRECFNCHKCHQSFPDKEFYVYDGKPFCRYHYHEANDSLCADPSCGQPIEGACAVAHTGERYHPEHLVCEFRFSASEDENGPKQRCKEQLEEYWEVDGLMLCEKHANLKMEMDIMAPDDDDEDDVLGDLVKGLGGVSMHRANRDSDIDLRAMRRKTQFIDLR